QPEASIPGGCSDLPPLEKPAAAAEFTDRAADLDLNHHANNKRYIDWILVSVPM
ncbi:MAG: hypothetical protein PWQ18_1294, partial [Clostridia bacterium]|nr:hypothetical protein [Clostridia bacterium]